MLYGKAHVFATTKSFCALLTFTKKLHPWTYSMLLWWTLDSVPLPIVLAERCKGDSGTELREASTSAKLRHVKETELTEELN